jgi:hypothetical protein
MAQCEAEIGGHLGDFGYRNWGLMRHNFLQSCAALAAAAFAQLCLAASGLAAEAVKPLVTVQPDPSPDVTLFFRDWTKGHEPQVSREETIKHLREAVKYVFVIFNENEYSIIISGRFPAPTGSIRTASIRARPRIHLALPKHIRIA